MSPRVLVALGLLVLASCGGAIDAETACSRLEKAGVAEHCSKSPADGNVVAAAAKSIQDFDVPGTKAHGYVASFEDAETVGKLNDANRDLDRITGGASFKNERRLLVVSIDGALSEEEIAKAKKAVEDL